MKVECPGKPMFFEFAVNLESLSAFLLHLICLRLLCKISSVGSLRRAAVDVSYPHSLFRHRAIVSVEALTQVLQPMHSRAPNISASCWDNRTRRSARSCLVSTARLTIALTVRGVRGSARCGERQWWRTARSLCTRRSSGSGGRVLASETITHEGVDAVWADRAVAVQDLAVNLLAIFDCVEDLP